MARTTNAGSRQTAPRRVEPAPADVANAPLAAFSRTASAVVRATGDAQQQIAARTGLLQKEAALKLRHAVTPAEVVAVQTALFVAGWQHSLQCSQDLARVWMAMGSGSRVH
jgi:hypothetical protein